jgi:hypothetical protein
MAARFFVRDATGVARQVKRLFVRDSGGVARSVKRAFVRDATGVARLFFSGVLVIPTTVSGNARYPQAASAGIAFISSGIESAQTNSQPDGITVGIWDPAGDGGNYDVRATLLSGTAPNWPGYTNTLGTWVQVTNDLFTAAWGLQVQQSAGGSESCVLQIDISLHGAGIPIASGQVTLEVSEGAQLT